MLPLSNRVKDLMPAMLRGMTDKCNRIGGINLGQGICQLPIPTEIKINATNAIHQNKNIYSEASGIMPLRQSVANKIEAFNKFSVDPLTELIITHGATGAFVCAVLALFNPGDEVILLEPFYPLHRSILTFYGVIVKTARINLVDLSIDFDEVNDLISNKTKGFVLCNPCNPCGKVFTAIELQTIGELAEQHNLTIISDEIYEYITYPGHEHISIAKFPQYHSRVVTITGFSKTFCMTGWRLGYASAPEYIISKMALIQDLLYVCPVTPLQYALCEAYLLSEEYFASMRTRYLEKLNLICAALKEVGILLTIPQGAYYLLADCHQLPLAKEESAADFMLKNTKVATVPGDVFFADPSANRRYVRFCFAHETIILQQAMKQICLGLNTFSDLEK